MINIPYGGSYTIKQTPNTPLEFKLEVEYETINKDFTFITSSGLYHYQKNGEVLPTLSYNINNISPFYPHSYPTNGGAGNDGGLSSDFFDLSSTNETINSNVYNLSGLSGGPLLLKSGSATLTFDPSGLEYNITYESAPYEYRPLSGSTLNSNNVDITGSNFTGSASEDPYNIYNRGDKDGVFIFEYSKSYSDAENGINNTFEDWDTSLDHDLDVILEKQILENINPHDQNFRPKITLFVASGSYEDGIIPNDSDYITFDEWEGNSPGDNEPPIITSLTPSTFTFKNLSPLLSSNAGDLFIKPTIKTSREIKYRLEEYKAIFNYRTFSPSAFSYNTTGAQSGDSQACTLVNSCQLTKTVFSPCSSIANGCFWSNSQVGAETETDKVMNGFYGADINGSAGYVQITNGFITDLQFCSDPNIDCSTTEPAPEPEPNQCTLFKLTSPTLSGERLVVEYTRCNGEYVKETIDGTKEVCVQTDSLNVLEGAGISGVDNLGACT